MELDVMLCDHAEVAGGKLFVSGAAIDRMNVPAGGVPPFVANFAVAGLVRVPWTATNANHVLNFRFETEDGGTPALPPGAGAENGIGGEMRFNIGRPPIATSGQEQLVPFAFNFQSLPLMAAGGYVVILGLDGTDLRRLGFTVALDQTTSFSGQQFG